MVFAINGYAYRYFLKYAGIDDEIKKSSRIWTPTT